MSYQQKGILLMRSGCKYYCMIGIRERERESVFNEICCQVMFGTHLSVITAFFQGPFLVVIRTRRIM